MKKYTFLPKAPCTFTLNNKYYRCELGKPFEVSEREARSLLSGHFRFRNHLRLITPLPTKATSKPKVTTEEKKPLPEVAKTQPSLVAYEEVEDPFIEPEIELPISEEPDTVEAASAEAPVEAPVRDPGEARVNLESLTKQQIVEYAASKGVDVKPSWNKGDMLEACKDL